ncbi:MAG TPA: BON domain-containing protein [Burkholderiales bacterium]|jgi:hyperosmotically inducible protein|nr:BON domain-containing protein [Burkholderiales bacterium]
MRTPQAARVLAATIGAVGFALALSAGAATSSDRSAEDVDRQAARQDPQRDEAARDQAPRNTEPGDAQDRRIAERVLVALNGDPELKEAMLRVQAENGQVRLVGTVRTFEQHDRALQMASAVEGVSRVDDGITLRESARPGASR